MCVLAFFPGQSKSPTVRATTHGKDDEDDRVAAGQRDRILCQAEPLTVAPCPIIESDRSDRSDSSMANR